MLEKVVLYLLIVMLICFFALIIYDRAGKPDIDELNIQCGKLGYDKAFSVDVGFSSFDSYCGHKFIFDDNAQKEKR